VIVRVLEDHGIRARIASLSALALAVMFVTSLVRPPVASASDPGSGPGSSSPPWLSRRACGLLLGFGAAAIVAARVQQDRPTIRALDSWHVEPLMDFGNVYGDGLTLGAAAAAAMAVGRIAGFRRLSGAGDDAARALLVSTAAVWALKLAVAERRPDGGRYSFPSGHATDAFCLVPVIARHWGWKAALPATALAVTTALARMEDGKHHLADVVFGAGLGLAIGSEVAGDTRLGRLMSHVSLTPRTVGLSWRALSRPR
jgi:membrane-associated phospholipid phosphatase